MREELCPRGDGHEGVVNGDRRGETVNIQILSGLHLEFYEERWRESLESLDPEGVDVLVVAGDLCPVGPVAKLRGLEVVVSIGREKGEGTKARHDRPLVAGPTEPLEGLLVDQSGGRDLSLPRTRSRGLRGALR
jgi:hypothetical protein